MRLRGAVLTAVAVAALAFPAAVASEDFPDDARVVFGESVRGRELVALRVGDRASERKVLIIGCIHGTERAGRAITRAIVARRPPVDADVWVVNDLNPDGAVVPSRQNAHGVDLNRNFPYRWRAQGRPFSAYHSGNRPLSEPEARAYASLVRRLRPTVTIHYHQHLNLVGLPYGVSGRRGMLAAAVRRYAALSGLEAKTLGTRPGSAVTWQRREIGRPVAFVVELPARVLPAASVERHVRAALDLAQP